MKKEIFFLTGVAGIIALFLSVSAISVNADYKYDYYSWSEMVTLLEDLETQSDSLSPDVFSLQIIGYSYLGNPIYAVKFSDNLELEEDDEPDVVIDSGMHSKEWNPIETNIKFIEYLFDAYYDGLHADHAEVVNLVDNFEIWIIPMWNPDGWIRDDLSGNGDPGDYWTDTTHHDLDYSGWRPNVQPVDCPEQPGGINYGIDLNRAFSVGFRRDLSGNYTCKGTNYPGPYPFAATESRVLKQFLNNHMISLVQNLHAFGQLFMTASETATYIGEEFRAIFSDAGTDPRLQPEIYYQNTTTGSGIYVHWLYREVDDIDAPDNHSIRGIQSWNYEVGPENYGVVEDGAMGQYDRDDGSNYYHMSSGELMELFLDIHPEIYKYTIKQSQYPFSPRYYTDMSRRPEAPETDLAIVGAKISEVGTTLPGCFFYAGNSDGRDFIERGPKRITWNVQNNGTSIRTINSDISICNLTDDPDCLSPTTSILTRTDVSPEGIETLTYDYDFQYCKDFSVTLTTGESNTYQNDLKRFVFTVTATGDTDCDGPLDVDDNCPGIPNGPLGGTCTSGSTGDPCTSPGDNTSECGTGGFCSMDQEDSYPPQGNDIGDACDCEGDFDCSGGVDATDVTAFLFDFGRSTFLDPCTNLEPCNGDFNCDLNVDAADVTVFLEDFGRSSFFNPCPTCEVAVWCVYP